MSISNSGFKYVGKFHAGVIAKVLNGADPGQLSQIYEGPTRIAVNLKTSDIIERPISENLLKVTDNIYTTIK